MRTVPQCVQHKHVNSKRGLDGIWRHISTVGKVGKQLSPMPGKDKSRGGEFSMRQVDGNHRSLANLEGARDDLRIEPKVVLPWLRIIEGIPKGPPKTHHRLMRGMNGHRLVLHLAKTPHVIESHDVIGMSMRDESGIQPGDSLPQALNSEFRSCIDHKMSIRSFHEEGCACPLIAGIHGTANRAMTSDHGNALGRARSEKGELQRHVTSEKLKP